jgi:HAMP domain-containing protein
MSTTQWVRRLAVTGRAAGIVATAGAGTASAQGDPTTGPAPITISSAQVEQLCEQRVPKLTAEVGKLLRRIDGFALVQRAGTGAAVTPLLRRNTLLSLGIGLVVAAIAGLLLARVLARPLRRTAQVAMTMSHGRRDLRAPVEGPREVAAVGPTGWSPAQMWWHFSAGCCMADIGMSDQ